jgi:hypothetical protein
MGLFKVFYTIGLPVSVLAWLLIIFGISASSGSGAFLDFAYLGYLFKQIDPYFWAALGVAFAIGLSVIGAAWCASQRACKRAAGRTEHAAEAVQKAQP